MHKRKGSTFGRIGFYTQLKYLVAFLLAGSLDEPWIVNTPELAKVSFTDCNHCPFLFYESACHFLFLGFIWLRFSDPIHTVHLFWDHH